MLGPYHHAQHMSCQIVVYLHHYRMNLWMDRCHIAAKSVTVLFPRIRLHLSDGQFTEKMNSFINESFFLRNHRHHIHNHMHRKISLNPLGYLIRLSFKYVKIKNIPKTLLNILKALTGRKEERNKRKEMRKGNIYKYNS